MTLTPHPDSPKFDHDFAIFTSLKKRINQYLNHNLSIEDLIKDLEILLNQLSDANRVWKKKFRSNWLEIEIAYSLALDEGRSHFDEEEERIVNESLDPLKEMVEQRLRN